MNSKLTQIDDDMLDQVSGGGEGVSVGGTIGLDPVGEIITEIGKAITSLPQLGWELTIGLVE